MSKKFAMVQDSYSIDKAEHNVDVVLHQENGPPPIFVKTPDDFDQAWHVSRGHTGHGFVQQNDPRLSGEQHGDLQFSFFAVRQTASNRASAMREPYLVEFVTRIMGLSRCGTWEIAET